MDISSDAKARPAAVFLIVEGNPVIASDLAETIQGEWPGSIVYSVPNTASALRQLDAMPSLTLAFVNSAAAEITGSGLADAILMREGGIVILKGSHSVPTDLGEGWIYVGRPYSSASIISVIAGHFAKA
ncbi:hypothetical protein [Brevirhabdus sp.]|uniref:hypothetical protein n=1 Tax=Brevirhabdus sp. TaxID=2004514 RepID=UPI004058BE45